MATSPLEVANRALARLGARQIVSSLDERSTEADLARRFLPDVTRECLALVDWRFASKAVALAQVGTAPAPWGYQFQLPADCVTPREVAEAGVLSTSTVQWPPQVPPKVRFATGLGADANAASVLVLWTDSPAPVLRYTAYVESVALWDAEFASAVAFALAAEMALPLTGKGEMRQIMLQGRAASLAQAAANNGQGAPRYADAIPEAVRVRNGWLGADAYSLMVR